MELPPLHVLDGCPRAEGERDAVRGLVGGTGDDLVHGRPPAHGEEGGPAPHRGEAAAADVEHKGAAYAPRAVLQELHRAMFLERADGGADPDLLGEPVHALDAQATPVWDGAD